MGGVACQQPTEPTKYTVSFDSGVESIPVEEGIAATKPTDPEKPGYTFGGWFNGEAEYDWAQPVTSDLSLTAKWTAVEYKITYLPEGVETDNPTTYTIEKETFELKAPTNAPDATKPNFVAWHKGEKPAEGEWAIVDSIEKGTTGDLTIVAEYADVKPWIVTFDSDGGSKVPEQGVVDGNKATEPKTPTKDGFVFAGWYEGEIKFDFATKITKDITLKAKWEEKKAEDPTPPAGEDPTTPPASGEETPKITYLVEKATKEFTVSNQWSQANISGMDKEYKKGDWIVTGGTVSIDGTKKIGQVYLQFGIDGGSKQIGGYYQTDSSQTSTSYTFYWIYRVDEDFKATYAQVACQEESNEKIVALAQDSKFTVSDFYVVHLPKADMAKLTTEIKVADTIEMPYKDYADDSNGKGYQLDLEAVNFTTTEGKIVCLYNRPAVKNGWKNHFINGGYVAKGENGYTAVYPGADAALISITRDVKAGNTCDWFQIGIVGQDTTEGNTLAITDLEVRIIPNF